jgi:hypothetical protein
LVYILFLGGYAHYADSLLKVPKKKAKGSLPLCLSKEFERE